MVTDKLGVEMLFIVRWLPRLIEVFKFGARVMGI